jgi:translation initiation factor 3 subunit A
MELAEARTTAARQKANKRALVDAARVSDLDQEETPESIMLSSMTEEVAKDRTDREVVVPWLKFLWESYRAILELLYKIPKLEKAYHAFAERAFKFCLEYNRVMEFKRLCDMLRTQLINLQKAPAATARVRTQWEWTPEVVEQHLKTRFSQLEAATTLELWNEAFRTVEDIYGIMVAGKKTPKTKLMMAYYDKLQKIFWVSDNKLFHAYAWFRYYSLYADKMKDTKPEERAILASSVLLSALTVPSTRDVYSFGEDGEEVVEKSSQMALLLDFQTNPSRQSLLNEIASKGFLADVLPELAALYDNLEVKFQPLTLVKGITAALDAVRAHPTLSIYAAPLQRVAVVRLLQQLGRVYSTVKLDFLFKLLGDMSELSHTAIERILIEGVAAKQLQLRINHASRCIHFGSPATASSAALDTQVSTLGSQLNKASQNISLLLGQKALEDQKAAARQAFLTRVAENAEDEYMGSLDRKAQIERRKEELERAQQLRQAEEKRVKEEEEANRKVDEARRLQMEEDERVADKRRKQQEKMEMLRLQKELEKHGVMKDESELGEMDPAARRQLLADAQAESQKARDAEAQKLIDQARRLDHITRALRIEGAAAVVRVYREQLEKDQARIAEFEQQYYEAAKVQHAIDLAEKQRFARMQALRVGFEAKMVPQQKAAHDRTLSKERQKAMKHRTDQAIAKARRLYYDAQERAEAEEERERERQAKEERARIELEEYERLKVEREAEMERAERLRQQVKEAEDAARAKREEEARNAAAPKPAAYTPFAGDRDRDRAPARDGGREGGRDWSRPAAAGDRDEPRGGGTGGGDSWGRGGGGAGGDRRTDRGPAASGDRWGSGGGADRRDDRDRDGAAAGGGGGWRGASGGSGFGGGPSRGPPPARDARDARDAPVSRDGNKDGSKEGEPKKDGAPEPWR